MSEHKHVDSATLYHVGRLTRIADASRREDGRDIPLGENLREACKHMEGQAEAISEVHARLDDLTERLQALGEELGVKPGEDRVDGLRRVIMGMTPPAPWSDH